MDTSFLTLGIFLIVVGLLLLLGELIVTSGLMLVLALVSILVGLVFLFRYDTSVGFVGLAGVAVSVPTVGYFILRLLPSTPLAKLRDTPSEEAGEALPHHHELQSLRGRIGKALTALRPSGMVEFDGRRVDCLTEGMMVEPGKRVRCVDVRGAAVIVRPVEQLETFDLEAGPFS